MEIHTKIPLNGWEVFLSHLDLSDLRHPIFEVEDQVAESVEPIELLIY